MESAVVITSVPYIPRHYTIRDGFVFGPVTEANKHDGIVIRYPEACAAMSPRFGYSEKTFEETLQYIDRFQIEKAIIFAEDISFLPRCSSLKYLAIHPATTAPDGFDYSPLYEMPELVYLQCDTKYGQREEKRTQIDYSKISGLRHVLACGTGHLNLFDCVGVETMWLSEMPDIVDLSAFKRNECLTELRLTQCGIRSLRGIMCYPNLKRLFLSYNRRLSNIEDIKTAAGSLRTLEIDHCAKIKDYSPLGELSALEQLLLDGNSRIPDIYFINRLKQLSSLCLTLNVENGDLSPCIPIRYVVIQNRRHYNMKDSDFSKDKSAVMKP